MNARYYPQGGFVADGELGPTPDNPLDWYVWHFTHVENLRKIAESGRLLPDSERPAQVEVGYAGIKDGRRNRPVVPDGDYPPGKVVSDHVPWYFAAKSPMLYVVSRGHQGYQGGTLPIVFFGMTIRALVESGLTWCASDRNAAATLAAFTRDVDSLGEFIDFDLMTQREWFKTPEDPDRPARRAAEILILGSAPLSLVTLVVAKADPTLEAARAQLDTVGGTREYRVMPGFYY